MRRAVPRLALLAAIAGGALWAAVSRDRLDTALLDAWLAGLGWWAPAAHVTVFAAGTVAFLPGSLFALAGGALFGPLWGLILNLTGATIGAGIAFLVARYLAGDWVARKATGRLQQVVSGVEAEGWRFVALVRLVPLFPFNLTNYALGLTRIGLVPYLVTSLICMAPGGAAYTWLGHAGREAMVGDAAAIRYGLLALGLLAAITFLPRLARRLRHGAVMWIEADELRRRMASDAALTVVDVRGPDELAGPLGHIPGAVSLPLGELPARLGEIKATAAEPVILVCRTDKRSAAAAAILRDAGFRLPQVLRGGMERWNALGFAVVRDGAAERSTEPGGGPA